PHTSPSIMGNVSSSLDEYPTFMESRTESQNSFINLTCSLSQVRITEIAVSTSVHDPYITFPVTSTGITAIPKTVELLEFIQDPYVKSISPNRFLLKLAKDKKLELKFKISIGKDEANKTDVKGLTFINAAGEKELERILTVEFNDDPNLHKHPNVTLVGNYEVNETQTEIEWTWMWSPPHNIDEVYRGWRNYCCFSEYDAKDNTFQLLATFTFWVAANTRNHYHRASKSFESIDGISYLMSSGTGTSSTLPSSTSTPWSPSLPRSIRPSSPENVYLPVPGISSGASSASSGGRRSSDDVMFQHEPEDGPLFRATLSSYEKKTGSLKQSIKRVLKAATAYHDTIMDNNEADDEFICALRAAAQIHPQAFQPILDSYLEEVSKKITGFRESFANQMSNLLIEPLRKMYENDIKVAESKKKDFEEESRDYYQFLSKYLSLKVDTAKEKKKLETDSKYQNKRKNFELKRFDYYAYMQDLHGGRKDQEILYHLTNFAEKQFAFYQQTSTGIQSLKPALDKLAVYLAETTKEIHLMRKEREERRRALETRTATMGPFTSETFNESENSNLLVGDANDGMESQPSNTVGLLSTTQNRFKGIRDLEHHDSESTSTAGRRKEGFLFATSRATQHGSVDPISKTTWHKYWCVLAGGQLCEYSNWKKQPETHNEPINLRFATVREARGADRRFCFEVITPQFRRIYQATSAEDMNSWITVISNAIESLLNGTSSCRNLDQVLTQDSNVNGGGNFFTKKGLHRRGTLPSRSEKKKTDVKKGTTPASGGDQTIYTQSEGQIRQELEDNDKSAKILEAIKGADVSNASCADCGARKTEWCSINLGIVLCIECSGIHRSLGTHISKIRSLTLDTTSYTPDLIQLIKSIGNARSNAIWEATLQSPDKQLETETPSTANVPSKKQEETAEPLDSDWVELINMITPSVKASSAPSSSTPSPTPSPTPKVAKGMHKPSSTDSREIKQKFITAKYVDRVFVDTLLVDEDRTATDLLFEAVKINDLPQAMQAIALKADINAARRFEVADDHGLKTPLLLALLHIDDSLMIVEGGRTLFPMAELLIQNGAHVEKVLFDNLEETLGVVSQPITRGSAKSVGTWAAEVVNDMKKSGKTVFDVVQSNGNIAAIRYLTPKVLARGPISDLNANSSSSSVSTTSTGGVVGGSVIERKPSPTLGRSISVSFKNALL
ncbi:11959_t:CDS:2, partial [Acaulospora morrowiae]